MQKHELHFSVLCICLNLQCCHASHFYMLQDVLLGYLIFKMLSLYHVFCFLIFGTLYAWEVLHWGSVAF
jgi:hypothetical protein